MKSKMMSGVDVKKLGESDPIPYDLLLDADPSKSLVDQYLKISDVYVAAWNEIILGIYVLCPVSQEAIEIKNISVKEEYQGRGLGTLMLQDAFIRAKQRQYKEMIIGTGNSSVGQLYLYQKLGFDITSIKRNFFVENYPDLLYENGIQVRHMLILTKTL